MDAEKGTINANFVKPETLGSIVTTILDFAISHGMTLEEIAQVSDLSTINYARLDSRISDDAVAELMSAIANRWADTAISMEIARSAPFTMLGGLAKGAQFANDIEAMLEWFLVNQTIIADQSAVHLEQADSEVALVIAHPSEHQDQGLLLEAVTGLIWRLLQESTDSEVSLLRVEFAHKKPVPVEAYESFFQVPVSFQTGRNALVFSRESLGVPVRHANPQMFSFVERHFAELRQQLGSDRYPLALAKLRQGIMENATQGEYGAAAAAAKANISLRTAQRLAKQHGTSLNALIDEIRLANAKSFLDDPEIDIATVGQLVGYTDARAFRRAFKRWTGLSPKEYRRETLGEKT
ncbi:AraC family transcriptional regulator ligand-binding domain-containing protein [Vacuolonema iberomarrocanum]|uniref:helix-turn-helix transcriptional regulator n=1 Tax=Vacuolonema iberomarrocanum TaxID=3454632 RepID=UPI0019DF2670|nr:AraC family transcriptional regulator ligand-binding domain-containing protein [filamentous cyanobacterium LEGE 07170]